MTIPAHSGLFLSNSSNGNVKTKSPKPLQFKALQIGATGFEPATSASRTDHPRPLMPRETLYLQSLMHPGSISSRFTTTLIFQTRSREGGRSVVVNRDLGMPATCHFFASSSARQLCLFIMADRAGSCRYEGLVVNCNDEERATCSLSALRSTWKRERFGVAQFLAVVIFCPSRRCASSITNFGSMKGS